jgi:hypothetical protein
MWPGRSTIGSAFLAAKKIFPPTDLAKLRNLGFIQMSMYGDGTLRLQNPSTGVFLPSQIIFGRSRSESENSEHFRNA